MRPFPCITCLLLHWSLVEEARPFQAACDSISFPTVGQVDVEQVVEAFTDGSCIHPKDKALRIAAGAVVVSHLGQSTTVWKGLLGGQQSIFRAEILAGPLLLGHSLGSTFTAIA